MLSPTASARASQGRKIQGYSTKGAADVHIVIFIVAALLILFGGGCTLVYFGIGLTEPGIFLGEFAGLWFLLGIIPIGVGTALWIAARRMRRRRAQEGFGPGGSE